MTETNGEEQPCYSFVEYKLDCEARALFRNNALVQSKAKMNVLLEALLEKPGDIGGRYQRLENVWPNQMERSPCRVAQRSLRSGAPIPPRRVGLLPPRVRFGPVSS